MNILSSKPANHMTQSIFLCSSILFFYPSVQSPLVLIIFGYLNSISPSLTYKKIHNHSLFFSQLSKIVLSVSELKLQWQRKNLSIFHGSNKHDCKKLSLRLKLIYTLTFIIIFHISGTNEKVTGGNYLE